MKEELISMGFVNTKESIYKFEDVDLDIRFDLAKNKGAMINDGELEMIESYDDLLEIMDYIL